MIKFYCTECNQKLSIDDDMVGEVVECPNCSALLQVPGTADAEKTEDDVRVGVFSDISNKLSDTIGVDRLEGFKIGEFFSQIFKIHPWKELENSFTVGSIQTTPDISSISIKWPTPWIFFHALIFSIVTYFLLPFLYEERFIPQQSVLIPFILNGIIGIPFSTLIFYWEMNIAKNVSMLQIFKVIWFGGWISIIITLLLHKIGFRYENPIWAGPIEETAKLLALLFFFKNTRYPYILNGLLLGAAVGVGFAVIENGHYLINFDWEEDILRVRAICSPIGHVLYTALVGGALWKCKETINKISFELFFNKKFFPVFLLAIGLHMFWNSKLLKRDLFFKGVIILVLGYSVVLCLTQEGLKQIKKIQKRNRE